MSQPAPLHHDADHDTQGGGCAGFVIVAAFWLGVAVGVLVSWAWRAWL